MFSRAFPAQIMAPTATGVPGVLGESITGMAHFLEPHIAAWNTLFALTQLAIALGIFWKRSVGWALAGSVMWAFGVWWFGEGFGGLFTSASPTMGFPGAVLLYALIAILIFPVPAARDGIRDQGPVRSVAERSPIGMAAARLLWAALWVGFAVYQLLPSNRGADSLSGMVSGMGSGEPGWISSLDTRMAQMYAGHGALISLLFAVACVVIGLSVFARWDIAGILVLADAGGGVDLAGRGLWGDPHGVRNRRQQRPPDRPAGAHLLAVRGNAPIQANVRTPPETGSDRRRRITVNLSVTSKIARPYRRPPQRSRCAPLHREPTSTARRPIGPQQHRLTARGN